MENKEKGFRINIPDPELARMLSYIWLFILGMCLFVVFLAAAPAPVILVVLTTIFIITTIASVFILIVTRNSR